MVSCGDSSDGNTCVVSINVKIDSSCDIVALIGMFGMIGKTSCWESNESHQVY
jgi:hypothetical protein